MLRVGVGEGGATARVEVDGTHLACARATRRKGERAVRRRAVLAPKVCDAIACPASRKELRIRCVGAPAATRALRDGSRSQALVTRGQPTCDEGVKAVEQPD